MTHKWEQLKDACNYFVNSVKYFDANNIADFGNNVIFENGLDCFGVVVKSGIETLATYLQEPMELKIEDLNDINEYLITKQFYYRGVCFYQMEYVKKSKIKEGVIYDNTTHNPNDSN